MDAPRAAPRERPERPEPPQPPESSESALRGDALERAGQGHLRAQIERLRGEARERLEREVDALDLRRIEALRRALARGPGPGPAEERTPSLAPADVFPLERDAAARARAEAACARGEELLRQGAVAWIVVAGGQGSRLRFDGPKGCFPTGPVTGRTLFELFARRLHATRDRYGAGVPWYVMTSDATDAATREFFARSAFFGLDPGDVFFFRQGMLPALDPEGRILLAAPDRIFLAPNGHGGTLAALRDSGALSNLRARGVRVLSYFQVDNPLARPSDPLFLGLHALEGARMSSKVVEKRDALEKVGVIGRVDGELGCIEYSDLPATLREARGETGALLYRAGNIAVHAIDVDFVEELTAGTLELPWHLARKDIEALDAEGRPARRPGVKFETFVFDALRFAGRSVVLEVERASEFSPVKNLEGEDSPSTCRRDLARLFAGWVARAGRPAPPLAPDGTPQVEVDWRLAEDADTFVARAPRAPRLTPGGHLYE